MAIPISLIVVIEASGILVLQNLGETLENNFLKCRKHIRQFRRNQLDYIIINLIKYTYVALTEGLEFVRK